MTSKFYGTEISSKLLLRFWYVDLGVLGDARPVCTQYSVRRKKIIIYTERETTVNAKNREKFLAFRKSLDCGRIVLADNFH